MQPTKSRLRSFGFMMTVFFVSVGLYPVVRHAAPPKIWAIAAAAAFALPALMRPSVLERPYLLWMAFGRIMGTFNTRALLGVTYFLLFAPVAFVLRCAGKDPMNRSFEPKRKSYRVPKEPRPASHMEHQF
jgi:hypothetical protein